MDGDIEFGLPDTVFSGGSKNTSIHQPLLIAEKDIQEQNIFHESHNNLLLRKCKKLRTMRAVCINSCLTLIILTILVSIGSVFFISEYSNIHRAVIFVNDLESIDVDEIKNDLKRVDKSIDQIQELIQALSQISNKTQFVQRIVYIVNYACNHIDCS